MTSTVACPRCHAEQAVDLGARTPEGFCTECDYPLFFLSDEAVVPTPPAPAPAPEPPTVEVPATAVVRLCPQCQEANAPTAPFCRQCGYGLGLEPWPPDPPLAPSDAGPSPARAGALALLISTLALIVACLALAVALAG